jgi:Cys-rich repeat protein
MDFPIPRLDKMSNQQLLVILVGLLIVFGLVSSFMLAPKDGGCCSGGNIVINKNRNDFISVQHTEWILEKFADQNNFVNATGAPLTYRVNITEHTTYNGSLVLYGTIDVKNTGKSNASIGNVVFNLLTKPGSGGWKLNGTNVKNNYGHSTVETCIDEDRHTGNYSFSNGLGSGDIFITDPDGNDLFSGPLYILEPNNKFVTFNYSATFNFEELGLEEGDSFREMIVITFLNASKTSGFGVCSNIDADGDGTDETYAYSEYSWDSPTSSYTLPDITSSTYSVNVSDMISSPPDSGVVTIPDWTINGTGILYTNGTNTWMKMFNATGNGGTTHTIILNSSATCVEDVDGFTFIRNKAWIDAQDMSFVSGSPTYSQINFVCGDTEPPNISIGDICTFTQDSYGGFNSTSYKNGFRVMNDSFSTVYPSGLQVGTLNWLKLTSANAVQTFLPQYGTPWYLTQNLTDPGAPPYPQNWSTSAAQFAGEVVALQLNVDLSDAGVMPQNSTEIYGNRTVQNTSTSFDGMSVRQVLGISNCLLGSTMNCSGYNSSDIGTLNEVLVKLNLNYYNCENDFNYTGPEDEVAPIIWSVEAIPDLLYPGQLYMVRVNATDDVKVASVNITINDSGYALDYNNVTGFWEISAINALYSGTHTVYVNAYDAVGNSDYDDSESITVDNEGPVILLNPPPQDGAYIVNGTLINLSVTDDNKLDKVWYSTDSGATNTTLANTTDPLYYIDTSGWTDGTYTVDVYANDSVGNETTQQYTFNLDSTDPVITSLSANDTVFPTNTVVNFTALVTEANSLKDDEVEVTCTNGTYSFSFDLPCSGGPSSWTCTDDITVNEPDGNYQCTATAEDLAGNTDTSDVLNITIDSTEPTITLNSPSPSSNTTYIQPGDQINITVTNGVFDDLDTVWYSNDSGLTNHTLDNSTDPYYYINTSGECIHTYDVWANDTAGNVKHVTYTFNQDGIKPVISSVVATPSTMYPSDPYSINATVSDNKALKNVTATVNGVEYILTNDSATNWFTTSPVAPGPGNYTVNVTAYDEAENLAYNDSTNITVNIPPGPVIVLHSPPNGAYITNSTPIKVNITSGGVNPLDAKLYNSSFNTTMRPFDGVSGNQYTIDVSNYPDGTYTFFVYANDTYPREANATYTFTIDSTKPVLNVSLNDSLISNGDSVTFTANVTDNTGLRYNKVRFFCSNGTDTHYFWSNPCTGTLPNLVCSISRTVSWADGYYNCSAQAWDMAWNYAVAPKVPLTIDSTAPVIVLNSPAADTYVTPGEAINYSVTNGVYDSLDTVQAQVDGGLYTTLSDSTDPLYYVDTTNWSDGEHCVNMSANDTAGNVKTLLNKCFKVDTTAPVIHTVDPDPDYMEGGDFFNISVNATDTPFPIDFQNNGNVTVTAGISNYTLTYNNTSGLWEGYNLQYNPPPEACGNVSLTVTATDPAGNSANDSSTNLTIVGCKPVIMLLSPANGSTINQGTTLDFTISHPFPVNANYSIDGGGNVTFSSPYNISTAGWIKGKTYNVTIMATDIYGYSSSGVFSFKIKSDTKPPNGDDDKKLRLADSQICPGDKMKFTLTYKGDGISGINTRLIYYDDSYEPALATHVKDDATDSNGEVNYSIPTEGDYSLYVYKKGDYVYKESPYEFTYEECPPDEPPGCNETIDCPSGLICVEGNCEPPECTDDLDCPSGQICVEGNCEPVPPECTTDADCAEGEICSNGECVPEPPECETDADCEAGFICDGGECEPLPGIDGVPPEDPVGSPGEEQTFDFTVRANGTAPLHNVGVTVNGGLEVISSDTIPVLNPGESGTVSVKVRIGDLEPGDYTVNTVYYSDEVSSSDQFTLKVTETVVPGLVFADPVLCLLPLLLLLLLALIWWFFLRRKIVTNAAILTQLSVAKKLGIGNKYFVSDVEYGKLGAKLKEKCKAVTVGKARVEAAMKKYGFPRAEATLFAVARKVKAHRILSDSKALEKYVVKRESLQGIKFASPKALLKKK